MDITPIPCLALFSVFCLTFVARELTPGFTGIFFDSLHSTRRIPSIRGNRVVCSKAMAFCNRYRAKNTRLMPDKRIPQEAGANR